MIGWLPLRQAEVELSTPAPVYEPADFRNTARPELMPVNHEIRAKTAAAHALRVYPGPVGRYLHDEILAWVELGWLATDTAPIAQVVRHIMGQPLPPTA